MSSAASDVYQSQGSDVHAFDLLECVEGPLLKDTDKAGKWSLAAQVDALERWNQHTGIPFAPDESIADLAQDHSHYPEPVFCRVYTSPSPPYRQTYRIQFCA